MPGALSLPVVDPDLRITAGEQRPPRIVRRARVAATQIQVNDALKSLNAADPTSTLGRFEERIRREEATVRGQQELAASSLEPQSDSLEDLGEQTEIEARLAALKSGGAQKAIDY